MARKGVATVPETRDVFPDLTVDENLQLGAYTRRQDSRGVAEDRARMFAMFPVLAERSGQPAGTLSGGEQQMLVIARAMMSRPRILLLDEPSLGLAPTIVDQIFEMIAALKQEHRFNSSRHRLPRPDPLASPNSMAPAAPRRSSSTSPPPDPTPPQPTMLLPWRL